MRRFAAALPLLAICAGMPAAASPGADPLTWLQRAATSARQTTYAGTVMHVSGDRTATSKITHVFIAGTEHEKIESLDGPRREVVRRNDDLQCYYPDAKTIRIDRRVTARFFPSLVSGSPQAIPESYDLRLGKVERVLGTDCQWVHLDPKDAMRYAQRLCAELNTGLLLRAKTLGAKKQVLDQHAFTDLRMGTQVSRDEARSTFHSQAKYWRKDLQPLDESRQVSTGWTVGAPPPGFRLVSELHRKLPNRPHPVSQLVLNDGLATMSVFIEPVSGTPPPAEAGNEDGAMSVFVLPMGDHIVTVLGEVPPAAVQQVARSVARVAQPAPAGAAGK